MTQLARWISILGHPFVMTAILVGTFAGRNRASNAVQPLLLVAIAIIVPVTVLMVRQVRRGRWGNVDASKPSERPVLFLVTLGGLLAAIAWLFVTDPKSPMLRGMFVAVAFVVVAAVLTRWIKLSLHAAFAAMTATALALGGFAIGYALIVAVPVVCWSRLVLARHRLIELVVGILLGALTGFALVRL